MLEVLLALPFVLALSVAVLRTVPRSATEWMAAAAPLLGLAILAWQAPAVMDGAVPRTVYEWIPQFGLRFALRLDGLAWMFAGLVLGIGVLIVMYAHYYQASNDSAPRFFACLLL